MAEIIVALDGMNYEEVIDLAKTLSDVHVFFKVNDLLDDKGVEVISELKKFGGVMADPKLHDIPNTIKNRMRKYVVHKPDFITVHASAGIEAMEVAVANKGQSRILAITILTSLSAKDIWDLGYVRCWQAESWKCYLDTVKERYVPNLVREMTRVGKRS